MEGMRGRRRGEGEWNTSPRTHEYEQKTKAERATVRGCSLFLCEDGSSAQLSSAQPRTEIHPLFIRAPCLLALSSRGVSAATASGTRGLFGPEEQTQSGSQVHNKEHLAAQTSKIYRIHRSCSR